MTKRSRIAIAVVLAAIALSIDPQATPEVDPVVPRQGLVVLIVEEADDRAKLTKEQLAILNGDEVRAYLNSHCAKDADGNPLWRIVDDDAPMDHEPKAIREAFAKPREGVPWLGISNGRRGVECALPANIGGTMKLLKKYGGP